MNGEKPRNMRNLNENDSKNYNMKKYGEIRGRSDLVDIHCSTYISKLIKISFNLINTPSTVQITMDNT